MALTQVQIIQSLGKALEWYQQELEWGVAPAELNHLTGRIGELYAAMITRGQMALETNQRGYDVVTADNERVSVKTITTSTHVTFNTKTLELVDRIMVLRINVDEESGVSVEELHDFPAAELPERGKQTGGKFTLSTAAQIRPRRPLENLTVIDEARFEHYRIQQYENGTILVLLDDEVQPVAKPLLRAVASKVGVDVINGAGGAKNTRSLGADIIKALHALGGR